MRHEIRSIATRGRANTQEFVTEYIVDYSDDGQAWTSYEGHDGVEEVLTQLTKQRKYEIKSWKIYFNLLIFNFTNAIINK